jgi:hypothetical protein
MEKNRNEKKEKDDRSDRNGSTSSNPANISASASSMDSRNSSEYREGDTGSKKLVSNDADQDMLKSTDQTYGNYQGEMVGEERFNYGTGIDERLRSDDQNEFNSRAGQNQQSNRRSYNQGYENQRPDFENRRNRDYRGGSYQGGYNQGGYPQQQNYGRGFEGGYGSSESRGSYEGDFGFSHGQGQYERNVRGNEWERNRGYDSNRGYGNVPQNSGRRNSEINSDNYWDWNENNGRYGSERFDQYDSDREWNQGRRENYRGPFNREQYYRSQPQGEGQNFNQSQRYNDRRESSYGSQGGRGGFQSGGYDRRNREEDRDRNYGNRWNNEGFSNQQNQNRYIQGGERNYSNQQNQNRYNQGGERNFSQNRRGNDQGFDYLNQGYGNQGYGNQGSGNQAYGQGYGSQNYGQNPRWNYPDDQWGPDYF